jgi:hypothetical protein
MPRLLTRGDDPSPISATGWPASSRNGGRHQIGTLAGFASEWVAGFHRNPHTVYVFRSKRADRVKLLVWDGSGLVLATKRLEAGQFCWPKIEDGVIRLSAAQLAALVEGLDWKRVHAARAVSVPAVAG